MSKDNYLLLGVMLLAALGAFAYFPFVATALVDFLGLRALNMTTVVAVGMFVGNTMAYVVSLTLAPATLKPRLFFGYGLIVASLAAILAAKAAPAALALVIVAASITSYRFAMGLTANVSRTLQLHYLPAREQKLRLFSYIKFCTSVGGAAGPLMGSFAIARFGFTGVLCLSAGLFIGALVLLAAVARRTAGSVSAAVPAAVPRGLLRTLQAQPRMVFLVSLTAMLHFIFEAQIYTAMALHIEQRTPDYVKLVGMMFALNAALLVVLTIPVLKVVNGVRGKYKVLACGSLMSVLALLASPLAGGAVGIALMTLLFTLGEIVTPQILIDMATDVKHGADAGGAIATFNFMTAGIGMSIGFWLGGVLAAAPVLAGAVVWCALYAVFLAAAAICCGAMRRQESGALPLG